MFEVFVGLFAISAISLLVAAAALIRPFDPFRTRLSALRGVGLSFLCAAAATFGAAILSESPARFDPTAHRGGQGEGFKVVPDTAPAPAANDSSRAERIAAQAAARAAAQARAEADAPSEGTPGLAAAPAAAAPPPAPEVGALMSAIEAADWKAATLGLSSLREGGYELSEALAAAERAARAKVRSIPPDDPGSARDGYRLLAALDPADSSYPQKAESYAAAAQRAGSRDVVDKLVARQDPEAGVTWLEHPDRPGTLGSRSTVLLSIGREGEGPPFLQMRTVYAGRSWLFVDAVEVSIGGTASTLAIGWFERGQDVAAYEWRDERPDPAQVETLRALAAANAAILRFQGMQEGRDEPLARIDRQALADVLAAWDAMTED
ncbi:hypothetical protein [uncultured Albimonas sp.]|uniref:hypothetical protein n=1 Tax=uncultured Albimonas sp. TaxID=1331701 RepID=UPI0030ECC4F2